MVLLAWEGSYMGLGGLIGGVLSGFGAARAGREQGKDTVAGLNNQYLMDLMKQKQFAPLAPYGTAARQQMFGGIVKAWGLDKMFGDEFLSRLKEAKIPGYSAPDFMPTPRANLRSGRIGIDPNKPSSFQFDVPRGPGYLAGMTGGIASAASSGDLNSLFSRPRPAPTGGYGEEET